MSRHIIDRPGVNIVRLAQQLGAATAEPTPYQDGDDPSVSYVRFLDASGAEVDLNDGRVQKAVKAYAPPPQVDVVADLLDVLRQADTVAKVTSALTTHLPRAFGRSE